ncbi:hypothetical protein SPBR_01605 [Sporothrix brasiliensis 5110]|uniref:Uncharacterized protein n=1 Tax=Sporothrix brasiliensis 5110 TaxID=1398154 RepID=A0A0C2FJE4_9PEZI|nr:uncharacterized protein SPBR_01605 [Sporothrix brasiliensis 5110]KIH91143.1 hypothetical protein SPBR_01605 [Sporothrix brasiliensis 5110]
MASQLSIDSTSPPPATGRSTAMAQDQEICFVNTTGKPAKGWRATNKTVRSHVMRRYKRQERTKTRKDGASDNDSVRALSGASLEAAATVATDLEPGVLSRNSSLEPSLSGSGPSDDATRTRGSVSDRGTEGDGTTLSLFDQDMEEWPAAENSIAFPASRSPDIRTWLDGSIDPFACLPIPPTPRTLMLLQQNAFAAIRTSVHADADDVWRRSCSSDPAWLFMTLFYASARFPSTSTADAAEDASYLLKSIAAINESISEAPGCVSDSTIATVACLANIDNLNGISSNAAVHTSGLIRMVELRGGLSNLGMRGILRRMVLWSDLLASSRLGRPPRFPFYQADTSAPLTVFTPSVSSDTYHLVTNGALDAILTVKHRLSIAQLLLSLHRLSLFLSLTDSLYLPWEASYPDRVYQVEYQFLTALFDDQVTAPTDTQRMRHLSAAPSDVGSSID